MSGYKDILKNGWHPEKDGSGLRGQMKSLVGRGDKNDRPSNHVAAPLASLRDPSSFGPPPKHVNAGGAVSAVPPPPRPGQSASPARQGQYGALPAPAQPGQAQYAQAETEAPPPPKPYRVDTTGLSTAHLPPPPLRRDGANGQTSPPAAPPPYSAAVAAKPGPPSLPPRLPPRTGTGSPSIKSPAAVAPPPVPGRVSTPEAPGRTGLLNQGSVNRLGAAGVSVPGLGIGRSSAQSPGASDGGNSQVNELQSRFAKFGTSASSEAAPSQGTSFAQKQAAFKTASAFREDPSSVSPSDARAAASTANNFRQRHGDQVSAGLQSAQSANQKYGMLDKVGSYTGNSGPGASPGANSGTSAASALGLLSKKKPAPPPPKKKPDLTGHSAGHADDAPPPIPLGTRPQF